MILCHHMCFTENIMHKKNKTKQKKNWMTKFKMAAQSEREEGGKWQIYSRCG